MVMTINFLPGNLRESDLNQGSRIGGGRGQDKEMEGKQLRRRRVTVIWMKLGKQIEPENITRGHQEKKMGIGNILYCDLD